MLFVALTLPTCPRLCVLVQVRYELRLKRRTHHEAEEGGGGGAIPIRTHYVSLHLYILYTYTTPSSCMNN